MGAFFTLSLKLMPRELDGAHARAAARVAFRGLRPPVFIKFDKIPSFFVLFGVRFKGYG
jgi:hypothetical protein